MPEGFSHRPVLLSECIEALAIRPEGLYVDGTLGRGGHAGEILKHLTTGRLFGIDRDEQAILETSERLSWAGERFVPIRGNFRDMDKLLAERGVETVDGILLDLGVSSPQLDDGERGFSYVHDAPLDMRMDRSGGITAADMVNTWPEEKLRRILRDYGEERYAAAIVSAIRRRREQRPIETTGELAELIRSAMPPAALREKQHPAKRTFQALRIAVNDELGAAEEIMEKAPELLRPGGRLAVISFHSLEDRIVKTGIARREKGCTCPPDLPVCVCGFVPTLKSVTRRPVTPDPRELAVNPRSRSAKLRVAERI